MLDCAEHNQTKSPKCFRCLDTICSVRACFGWVSARICHMLPRTHVGPTGGEGRGGSVVSQVPRERTPAGFLTVTRHHKAAITIFLDTHETHEKLRTTHTGGDELKINPKLRVEKKSLTWNKPRKQRCDAPRPRPQ